MRLTVNVTTTAAGWEVQVPDPDTGAPLADPGTGKKLVRTLRRTTDEAFPLPPQAEIEELAAGAAHRQLCTDETGNSLSTAYYNIMGRQPGSNGVVHFGRYLFDTLIGEQLWAAMRSRAGDKPLELALSWPGGDAVLNRLPWEMMCDPGGVFLASQPGLAITRLVPGSAEVKPLPIKAPLRVLFVVGSNLRDDDVIRPGAEYLGLLRGLSYRSLTIKHHLLLAANTARLEAAMRSFRPSVVHFICHGGLDGGRGYLTLKDEQNAEKSVNVFADRLITALRVDESLPPVVVLNACFTATVGLAGVGQVTVPLAAELVSLGIPVVVGMAGRVADQACRLFTRRFYESLLESGHVGHDAAQGRRAALGHGTNPSATVDWALPTLFLAEGVGEQALPISRQEGDYDWHALAANDFAPPGFPAFCDRFEVLHWYTLLMAEPERQKEIGQRKSELLALVATIRGRDAALDSDPRYGRTRLLKELAAQAVRDGSVPVLLAHDRLPGHVWITDTDTLLKRVVRAAMETARSFAITADRWKPAYTHTLLNLAPGAALPHGFPLEIELHFEGKEPGHKESYHHCLALALVEDLKGLLEQIDAGRPEAERGQSRLLLLIDDVHAMGGATLFLINHLLRQRGPLWAARERMRAVLTAAEEPASGQAASVEAIKEWRKAPFVDVLYLEHFKEDTIERLAYEYFLLHWQDLNEQERPLVVSPTAQPAMVNWFFGQLQQKVKGVPSYLESPEAQDWIGGALALPQEAMVLQVADDETLLDRLQQEQGGRQ